MPVAVAAALLVLQPEEPEDPEGAAMAVLLQMA
jgi:hypothetical protein